MLICDICKKPNEKCTKKSLYYGYGCKAYQARSYDICENCRKILEERKTIIEIAFIYNATEREILDDLDKTLPTHEEGDLYG